MRKSSILWLGLLLLTPSLSRAANATARDFDEQGMALYRQGLYAKSISYFQNAVQADPNDWQGYENLGNAYVKMNDNQNALAAYQKSQDINPDNKTLNSIVQNLQSSTPAQDNSGDSQNAPPPQASNPPSDASNVTVQVTPRRPWRRRFMEAEPVYKDGLAPINHAKMWLEGDLAYNWANQQDLFTSANTINGQILASPPTTGLASASHNGVEFGGEWGFQLDPYNGIAIGLRVLGSDAYTSNLNLQDGGDFEDETIQTYAVPLTLDYYLFLPDKGGRFFLTAGVGYYFADARVDDNYSYDIVNGFPSTDEVNGDLQGGAVGFQVGIGREFEISRHLGLRIFARGRYAKITNIQGTVVDANGNTGTFGLMQFPDGSVHADDVGNIGNGEHYATLDYTGFDVGVGLTFF